MSEKKTVNWAIMGAGNISYAFAKFFPEKNEKCHLLAIGSRSYEKAKKIADECGVERAYGSYEEMLADADIDAVYIGTTTAAHYDCIMACLKAGKHVLCEKTITVNYRQLKECVDLAREKGLILAEALTSIYLPVMKFLKDRIDSGIYGKVQFITVTCGSSKEFDPKNRFYNPESGGGALFDIGCYAFGFANYFLSSKPTVVKSEGLLCSTGVDTTSATILRNADDQFATVMLAFDSKTDKIGIIACQKAYIEVRGFIRPQGCTVTYMLEEGRKEVFEFPRSGGFDLEAIILSEDILAGKKECEICPMDFTLSILEIMDQVRPQWGMELYNED